MMMENIAEKHLEVQEDLNVRYTDKFMEFTGHTFSLPLFNLVLNI